jgi:hypothetical protein
MSKTTEQFHKTRFDHHTEMAKVHGENAEAHKGMMQHFQDEPEHAAYHKTKHSLHKRAAASHQNLADYHENQMKKAADDQMTKRLEDVPASLQNAVRSELLKLFGDTLVPSLVSRVAPTAPGFGLRAVPRNGQREVPSGDAPNVPLEFQKLFSAADGEDLLRQ